MLKTLIGPLGWRAALWWRRGWASKALGLTGVGLCALLIRAGLEPARERLSHLAPRVADVGRLDVHLDTPLSDDALARLRAALTLKGGGVPVHQRSPRLALVGTVEAVERLEGEGARLTLGIYRDLAPALLRADAALTLTLAPPSLELLVEDLTRSARGRAALAALRAAAREARAALLSLRGALVGALRAQVPADLWERLSADEVVRASLQGHFEREVLKQIPWGELLEETLSAPEFERIREAALRGVDTRPLIGEALKGAAKHALKSRSVLRDFNIRAPIESGKRVLRGAGEKVDSSLNAGTQRAVDLALEKVKQNLKAQDELLKREGGALLAQSAERAQLSRLLKGMVRAVAGDQELSTHLQARYGEDLWAGLARGVGELLRGGEVRGLLAGLTERLKGALGAVGRALLFDHDAAAPGPNPLLLSVVEEQLRGEVSPVVHITPGAGAPVGEGFVFQERRAEGRSLWDVFFEQLSEEGAE